MNILRQPLFLIAMPQLLDPRFSKSVVLLLEHDRQGAFGLVINKATEIQLGTFAASQGLGCHRDYDQTPLYFGGPVSPEKGWILHQNSEVPESQPVLPGLFLSNSVASMKQLFQSGGAALHVMLGYAGWSSEQLDEEIRQGAWLMIPAKIPPILEYTSSKTWDLLLREMGVDPLHLFPSGGLQ